MFTFDPDLLQADDDEADDVVYKHSDSEEEEVSLNFLLSIILRFSCG